MSQWRAVRRVLPGWAALACLVGGTMCVAQDHGGAGAATTAAHAGDPQAAGTTAAEHGASSPADGAEPAQHADASGTHAGEGLAEADHAAQGQTDAHGAEDHGGEGHGDEGHAAADGHVDTSMPPLVPDVPLLVFSLVLFWVFLWAARRFAWLPLIRGLDAREGRVNRALAEADAARKMAEQLLHDHEVRMAGVTEQVKGIVAEARHQAEQTRASMIASAEAEAARIRDAAIADVQAARGQVLSELESILDSQVAEATEQILR